MAILVTGGAGFIGSVTVERLRELGEEVVVLDNLSRGHRSAVDPSIPLYIGNIAEPGLVERVCAEHAIEACIHFAAYAYPGESCDEPGLYYENNLLQSIALAESLRKAGVTRVVFSSTCAAFGEPQRLPIDETHPQNPPSPYGWSKMVFERLLESYDQAYGFRFVALRYFNACGATATRGEDHDPETHLLPLVLWAAMGRRDSITIFGEDYPTPDGTCIRDYVHVADLAEAHVLALGHLRKGGQSEIVNLGNGTGFSVKECIACAEEVAGNKIKALSGDRRSGDVSHLVADSAKARALLGWDPKYTDLSTIVESSYRWFVDHPNGYKD